MIRLKRTDTRMVRLMGNARPQDMICAEKVRTRQKLNNMRECLEDRRLQLFIHPEKMEENASYSNVESSNLLIVSPVYDVEKHGIRSFIRNFLSHVSMGKRR